MILYNWSNASDGSTQVTAVGSVLCRHRLRWGIVSGRIRLGFVNRLTVWYDWGRDSNLRAVSWTIPPATLWRSESRTRVNVEWPWNTDRKTIFEEIETWNFDLRGNKWMICKRSVMIDALIAGGSATWLSKFSKGTNKQNVTERYQSTQHRFLEPMTVDPARSRPCTRTDSRDSYSPLIT